MYYKYIIKYTQEPLHVFQKKNEGFPLKSWESQSMNWILVF